jgi:hypothetical protein
VKEARRGDYDLVEENMDGVQTRISRMSEKGIRMNARFRSWRGRLVGGWTKRFSTRHAG